MWDKVEIAPVNKKTLAKIAGFNQIKLKKTKTTVTTADGKQYVDGVLQKNVKKQGVINSDEITASKMFIPSGKAAPSNLIEFFGKLKVEKQKPINNLVEPYVTHLTQEHKKKLLEFSDQEFKFEIGNTVEIVNTGGSGDRNRFKWVCYVKSLNPEIETIKSVEFKLHPTFTLDKVIVTNPKEQKYEVCRVGWGTFDVGIKISTVSGQELKFVHPLCFDNGGSSNVKSITCKSKQQNLRRMTDVEPDTTCVDMHGLLGKKEWPAPICVVECNKEARPGYNSMKAHEYNEDPRTLQKKVKILASLLKKAKNAMAYTGAGISTSAGINDYASKAKNTTAFSGRKNNKKGLKADPSLGHRILGKLWEAGYLKHWVQQNHDGLPQKAGFPQHEINEIHGAWFDPSNPVVPMSGTLRGDLYEWMHKWQKKADLTIAMGTSLCGMNADNCVSKVAKRFVKNKEGYGSVIVGLQRTVLDNTCSLRIFAPIDEVVALLATELKITIPVFKTFYPDVSPDCIIADHVYRVPYNKKGYLTKKKSEMVVWDLRPKSKIIVVEGPGKGFLGYMNGVKEDLHYTVCTPKQREGSAYHGKGIVAYTLGSWWIETATKGLWSHLPVCNTGPSLKLQSEFTL